MTYHIQVTGRREDVLAAITSQAATQRAGISGAREQADLDAAVDDATKQINEFAGPDDTVSASLSGHLSSTDQQLGVGKSVGITVMKAATQTPSQVAGATGQPVAGTSVNTAAPAPAAAPTVPTGASAVGGQAALDAARTQAASTAPSGTVAPAPTAAPVGGTIPGSR